jgi:hypothetical protein
LTREETAALHAAQAVYDAAGVASDDYLYDPCAANRRIAIDAARRSQQADAAAVAALSPATRATVNVWQAAVRAYQSGKADWPSALQQTLPRDLLDFVQRPTAWIPAE